MSHRWCSVATSQPSVLFVACWLIRTWVTSALPSGCVMEKMDSRRLRDKAHNFVRNQISLLLLLMNSSPDLLQVRWEGREPRAEFVGVGTSRWCLFTCKYSAMPALHLAGRTAFFSAKTLHLFPCVIRTVSVPAVCS